MNLNSDLYSESEKRFMLSVARKRIEVEFSDSVRLPDFGDINDKFLEQCSCFVTLHTSDHELRGCIGNIMPFEPLIDNILHNAYNAAFRDSRFSPVSSIEELESLTIEISVLTAPEEIESYKIFKPGKDGIILEKSGHSSVFLPQVALEQGWNIEMTLTHLAMKAGLYPDEWKDNDCKFKVFQAIYFSEK
jgi:AmmeMemoRadiSam system protein A